MGVPDLSRIHVPVSSQVCKRLRARKQYDRRREVLPSVMEAIGDTPIIALRRFCDVVGIDKKTEILGKVEFMNVGGSIKDRVARSMIEYEIDNGKLPPGSVVVEASSGNTGIGLALAAAAHQRSCLVTMNEAIALEKEQVLRILGSEVIRTPLCPWFDERSHLGEAAHQTDLLGGKAVFFNQYQHPANPAAHYVETAQEILDQTGGNIDYLVVSVGTGGTAAGLAARLREALPLCKVVVVEPAGSVASRLQDRRLNDTRRVLGDKEARPPVNLADSLNTTLLSGIRPWKVEGIGKDFLPPLLDARNVDLWYAIPDADSFKAARDCIKSEGLLVGGSCGTALAAAVNLAKGEGRGKRILVILPDGARNYLSTFLDDGWMMLNKFMKIEEVEIKPRAPPKDHRKLGEIDQSAIVATVEAHHTCQEAVSAALSMSAEFIMVMQNRSLLGLVSRVDLVKQTMMNEAQPWKPITSLVTPSSHFSLTKNHTWLQGLHVIDEMERVWRVSEGYVLVDGSVISRRIFLENQYPVSSIL